MAQWIRRLTTNQEIPGSTPGSLNFLFLLFPQKVVYVDVPCNRRTQM